MVLAAGYQWLFHKQDANQCLSSLLCCSFTPHLISFPGYTDTSKLCKTPRKYHATEENTRFKFGHSLFCQGDRQPVSQQCCCVSLRAINSQQLWITRQQGTVHPLGHWILTIRFLLPQISSSETETRDQHKIARKSHGSGSSSLNPGPLWKWIKMPLSFEDAPIVLKPGTLRQKACSMSQSGCLGATSRIYRPFSPITLKVI